MSGGWKTYRWYAGGCWGFVAMNFLGLFGGRANPATGTLVKGQPYWQDQGWSLRRRKMEGYFRTHYGSFRGVIELSRIGKHRYYMFNPPTEMQRHSHWGCFLYRPNGAYWVHFNREPKNVDAGILAIEQIIRESMEL
jgi:hypothetical protein